jgi:hypothetical protein
MLVAAATIVAKNHLSLARVVAQSFSKQHPEIRFVVFLADEIDGYFEPDNEDFEVLPLSKLGLEGKDRLCFRYPQQSLSYACTPMLIEYLLNSGFGRVLFFKQESMVLARMDDALERLQSCSVLLTPHLVDPLAGCDATERELTILLSGVYNIGFVGMSESESSRRLLSWWSERTFSSCDHAVDQGVHFEQRWLDLAPSYFEGVERLRDPSYNVAHWNLPERHVEIDGDRVLVDGLPCRLFRFSGYDHKKPDQPTRYFSRLEMCDIGDAARVFAAYHQLLEQNGVEETCSWPYAWDQFDNGVEIPEIVRWIYRDAESSGTLFEQPFATEAGESFFRWLRTPVLGTETSDGFVTNLWWGVHRRRADVREAYPNPLQRDRKGFLEWIRNSGRGEHGIPKELW